MAIIPDGRDLVYEEEVARNAGVTEATLKKLGAISNFLNRKFLERDDFKANGSYRVGVGSVGLDGILVFPENSEIVKVSLSNQRKGISGVTEFDITWFSAPGVSEGSIFSTKPSFDTTAPDDAYMMTEVIDVIDEITVVGGTNPRLSKTTFLKGEAIRCDLVSGMSAGEDAQISVFYRPIN